MGVKMTGRVTAADYAKRDLRFCSSGPIILHPSKMNYYARPRLSQSRVNPGRPFTRRQGTILSYLQRWLNEVWYNIIRRVRHIFSSQIDPSCAKKIPSDMDSELENAFWREGIQRTDKARGSLIPKASSGRGDRRSCGLGDHGDVYYLYRAKPGSKSLSTDDSELETSRKSEYCSTGLKKRRYLPRRVDSPLSFDDEYSALYETKGFLRPGGACGKETEKCDSMASSGKNPPDLRTNAECPMDRPEDNMDGDCLQTVCFGSVWYSRSELHTSVPDPQATVNRTRHTSRIPRVCSRTRKPVHKN